MFIICILFGLGFFAWVSPWIKEKWQTTLGKFLITALHVMILFLAIIPSRFFVAEVIGLPPQDFEVTVSVVALELYPALWALLVAFALIGVFMSFLLFGMLCAIIIQLIGFLNMLVKPSRARLFIQVGTTKFIFLKFIFLSLAHAFGAAIISIAAASAWDWNAKFLMKNPEIIKWVAYVSDFQLAAKYPGIDSNKRLRLHENGVVSYAEKDGWGIKVTVGKVEE
jgi:hypothetical protein